MVLLGSSEEHEIRPTGSLNLILEAYVTGSTGSQAAFTMEGAEEIPTRRGFSVGVRQRL